MASQLSRRDLLRRGSGLAAWLVAARALHASTGDGEERRYTVAFANITEEPGVALEGTGFTGRDVRESFELAARQYPVDMVFYDNQRDNARALANAEDAIARRVSLYILYHRDGRTGATIAEKLRTAGIPMLAINVPITGVPLYTVDNLAAGRIAGEALGEFAARTWRTQAKIAVVVGPARPGTTGMAGMAERAQGVTEGLARDLPGIRITTLDTQGNPAQVQVLLGKFLAAHPGAKTLIAALDDATALAAKSAVESAGRLPDAAIVSHGADRSIHGGASDRKELDPNNRSSIVLGSVAFRLDRYGYEVLPLALGLLRGSPVPARTATAHKLITAANVFAEYPPYDMN